MTCQFDTLPGFYYLWITDQKFYLSAQKDLEEKYLQAIAYPTLEGQKYLLTEVNHSENQLISSFLRKIRTAYLYESHWIT